MKWQLEYFPHPKESMRLNGYGLGMLCFDGLPYWYSNAEDAPLPIEWTWVDLLEHLVVVISSIETEKPVPFGLMSNIDIDLQAIWENAEKRWLLCDELLATQEELDLLVFIRLRNLAAGWKGLSLPALLCLRLGDNVLLIPEKGRSVLVGYHEFTEALLLVGNMMADSFSDSNNQRVSAVVQSWKSVFPAEYMRK